MKKERTAISQSYQYIFNEISTPPEILNTDPDESEFISDRFNCLNDLALKRIFVLARKFLSKKQIAKFSLLLGGKTQVEIAAHLGVCQSSVTKMIMGNQGRGGIGKKLRRICLSDNIFRKIIKEMFEEVE